MRRGEKREEDRMGGEEGERGDEELRTGGAEE